MRGLFSIAQRKNTGYEVSIMQEHRLTVRSFVMGFAVAVIMCGVNSFLVLRFGILEEGPAIAALFFFAIFFRSTKKITTAEMVIVATMGSAGGSLGFISNFFAAQVMIAEKVGAAPYTIWEMTVFGTVTSIIGLISVVALRQILIIQDAELPEDQRLPWVGAKAVRGMIDSLLKSGDSKQPRYLAIACTAATLYVILQDPGWTPSKLMFGGLAAYGAGVAFSPFVWGGAYLMGFRTCVGFLVGGIALLIMAPGLPKPSAPHTYVWPGIAFLVTSGLTALAINWKVVLGAVTSLFNIGGGRDRDPIMSSKALVIFSVTGILITTAFLIVQFKLTLIVIVTMMVMGGLVLNMIATRAAAQTYFNPARVMGIILMGMNAIVGSPNVTASLTGAGFVAGAGAQGGNLTGDMAYGFWYRIKSSWQFWTQAATVLACPFVAAISFYLIRENFVISLSEKGELAAPIGKIWATMGLMFDPAQEITLPPFAVEAMWIAGIAGIVWALIESKPALRKLVPCSIGFGLALILPIKYDIGFFAGGLLMWFVLPKLFKIRSVTLNTIAIACIVGEGLGGIGTATLKILGIL